MKDLNRLISSSEMDITHDDSSPVDSDISVNTLNGGLEVSLVCVRACMRVCVCMCMCVCILYEYAMKKSLCWDSFVSIFLYLFSYHLYYSTIG